MSRTANHLFFFKITLIILFFSLSSVYSAHSAMYDKSYSPITIKFKMKRTVFEVREPVEGTIILENRYPSGIPATFRVKLFLEGRFVTETMTSIKHVPTGKTEFIFKNFGIPIFNTDAGKEGMWRIRIAQQNLEASAADVVIRITPAVGLKNKASPSQVIHY